MPERIRFTLIEDELDVRSYDFDTDEVQIGCDPERGDNLLIDLPPRLRHVRAKVFRTTEYVEMEVKTGPIWVQNSKLEEGDVVELSIGDLLIFGTKKPRGVRLRYETAAEAGIFMDDVADWSVSAAPKKKRQTAEDDLAFEEEIDPTEGMNAFEKARYRYREMYAGFAKWRKKSAKVKYWISLASLLWSKVGKATLLIGGMGGLALGWFIEADKTKEAEEVEVAAVEDEASAVRRETDAFLASNEIERLRNECKCPGAPGPDAAEFTGAERLLKEFSNADPTFAPMRPVSLNAATTTTLAAIVGGRLTAIDKNKLGIPRNLERACGIRGDRMVQAALTATADHALPPLYAYVPFVETQWCGVAIDRFGRRGVMQMSADTAEEAFDRYDKKQSRIPKVDAEEHLAWLEEAGGRRGVANALRKCEPSLAEDYAQSFYGGESNSEWPNRIDPNDPRTDWEEAMAAAYTLLQEYDGDYQSRGFKAVDAALLSLAAYDLSPKEVERWIKAAKGKYGIEEDAALTYLQVYGGGVERLAKAKDPAKRERIKEAMDFPTRVLAYYLAASPRLSEFKCTE